MRRALILALLAAPAQAWEFTPAPICTLTHETPQAELRVTFDAAIPQYAITIARRDGPWPAGPVFAIRFDGPRGLTISTDRQKLTDGGRQLTVTDRGFGNVLNGLQFNRTATALIAGEALTIPLDGAAGPVAEFRDCPATPSA